MRKCCHGAEYNINGNDSRKKAHHENKHKKFIFSSIIFGNFFFIGYELFEGRYFPDHDGHQ